MIAPLPAAAFPVTGHLTYLDHAGVAPLPAAAVAAMGACAQDGARLGVLGVQGQADRAEEVRGLAAQIMGVPVDDVAFVKNTTEGLGFVANGLEWKPGDRVVVPDLEFPSTLYPWLALEDRGVRVDRVAPQGPGRALPVEAFAQVIADGPPPRVVVASWVQYGRGWRTDLAALARVTHDAGGLLCADVIQGLGAIPSRLEEWGVDFAAADSHKWLLGPAGIGVLYVRGSRLDLLRPLEPGWASVAHRTEWENLSLVWDPTARRLEGGSANLVGTYGFGASLELLLGAGVEAVWAHIDALCDRAGKRLAAAGATVLSERDGEGRSGIVTFELPGHDPAAVVDSLLTEGIVCSPRGGGVRVSPHGYTTADDIDRLVAAVAAEAAEGPAAPP